MKAATEHGQNDLDGSKMISDLIEIKRKLLEKHKQYEQPDASEYREGILGGLTVALQLVDQLMESEDEAMAREYEQNRND